MKKILLFFILFFLGVSIYSQKLTNISGPSSVKPGQSCTYTLKFSEPILSPIEINLSSNYGCFHTVGGKKIIKISQTSVNGFINVTVYWEDVDKSDGYIIAYITGDNGSAADLKDIKISKDGGANPGEGNSGVEITGPPILYTGDIATYSFHGLMTSAKVKWSYNSFFFTEVKNSAHDGRSITLKTNKVSGISTVVLSASSESSIGDYDREISIMIMGDPKIITTTGLSVCENGLSSFQIQNIGEYPGASIMWEAGDRMTLIMGQGTSNATFRATGNGVGVVKVKVKYDEKEFNAENSDVWVGPYVITGITKTPFNPSSNSYFILKPVGTFPKDKINWSVWSNGTYNSAYYQDRGEFEITGTPGAYRITVTTDPNSCGVSEQSIYFEIPGRVIPPIIPGDPGPIDPIPHLNSAKIANPKSTIISVKIYNLSGVLLYSEDKADSNFDIRSTVLADGIYVIEKWDGENKTIEKVLLNR